MQIIDETKTKVHAKIDTGECVDFKFYEQISQVDADLWRRLYSLNYRHAGMMRCTATHLRKAQKNWYIDSLDKRCHCVVCCISDTAIGWCIAYKSTHFPVKSNLYVNIYVRKKYRGNKIALTMLKLLKKNLPNNKLRYAYCLHNSPLSKIC